MKNVLFWGLTTYSLSKENPVMEKKFAGLSKCMNVFVMARGDKWFLEKYNTKFFLISKSWSMIGFLFVGFFRGLVVIFKQNINIIICPSPGVDGFVAWILAKLTRRELIVEAHGDWIESLFLYHHIPFKNLVKKTLQFFSRCSLRGADKIRVISNFTNEFVKQYAFNKPIILFPTFTDLDIFLQEKTQYVHNERILFVGALYRLKGVHFLLQAFSTIKKKYPAAELVIVGDGPYKETLLEMVDDLRLSRVHWRGKMSLVEVKKEMQNSCMLILPSLSEGLGRVLLEAAALGLPLIGSRTGGIPDIISHEKNGLLFEPGNVEDLAKAIEHLLEVPKRAEEMGMVGKKMAQEQFSTKTYFNMYRKMIDTSV